MRNPFSSGKEMEKVVFSYEYFNGDAGLGVWNIYLRGHLVWDHVKEEVEKTMPGCYAQKGCLRKMQNLYLWMKKDLFKEEKSPRL